MYTWKEIFSCDFRKIMMQSREFDWSWEIISRRRFEMNQRSGLPDTFWAQICCASTGFLRSELFTVRTKRQQPTMLLPVILNRSHSQHSNSWRFSLALPPLPNAFVIYDCDAYKTFTSESAYNSTSERNPPYRCKMWGKLMTSSEIEI